MAITLPTITPTLTLADFLRRPEIDESPAWEFHDRLAHQKPMPGVQHSRLQIRLAVAINAIASGWEALPELRCTFGDRSIVPDLSVLKTAELPIDSQGMVIAEGIEFAPAWAIEILSPAQGETRVIRNLTHCLAHGSQLGWLVLPRDRVVVVFLPDRAPVELAGGDRLPVLPDLDLNLTGDRLFGWLAGAASTERV
ncbi:Uma2 family endonuclease [Limnothrix sp. PR1529]|uniref:Uma2 family endonuclease n=1 Tax=Limnothrix sp. PR1529 TaxID=1704291 RepID=UPI000AF4300B|nr:Uma2 family endonuclease [Limnothrix sp. PR1529]